MQRDPCWEAISHGPGRSGIWGKYRLKEGPASVCSDDLRPIERQQGKPWRRTVFPMVMVVLVMLVMSWIR